MGSLKDIEKEIGYFSFENNRADGYMQYSTMGILLQFVGVTDPQYYTPYVYTEENKHKLYFRKRHNCFYIQGDSGQHEINSDQYLFRLAEVPIDMFNVNVNALTKVYNVNIAPKKQYQYY